MRRPADDTEARDAAFYRAGFALAAAYVLFGVVLNYGMNFVLNEWSYLWLPVIYRRGLGFAPSDLWQSFPESWTFDGGRTRYLSYLFVHLNAKFRILLERFMPPHPSFSFTWIFNVVLAPLLLFKLMERLSGKRSTAWACTALYLASPGFLSGITFLANLGKPLTHFAMVCALFLAGPPKAGGGAASGITSARRRLALAATLFIACFLDETAWFAAAAVTILFCPGIPRNWKQARAVLANFAPLLFFLVLIRFFVHGGVAFWQVALNALKKGSLDLTLNSYYLLGSHFLPQSVRDQTIPWAPALFLTAFGLVSWLWSRGVESAQKSLLSRTALLLAAYLLFHAIIMTEHPVVVTIVHCCFYYGTLTSLFLAMFFSVLLTAQRSGRGRGAAKVFFVAWMICLCAIFGGTNRSWKNVQEWTAMHLLNDFPGGHGHDDASGPSFREVLRAWRSRYDPAALARLRQEYPQSAYWLFNELDFIAAPDASELAQRQLPVLARILFEQGIDAVNGGALDQGLGYLLTSISVDAGNPSAHYEAGYAYELKGDVDHAIEQTQAAIALDPNLVDARINLGFSLEKKGRYREAAAQYQEALKLAPGNQLARNDLATVQARLASPEGRRLFDRGLEAANRGALDEGLTFFLASISADAHSPSAHFQAGYIYFLKGDVDHAIEQTRAAVALDPSLVDAHNNLGFFLEKKGHYREAVAQFQEAIKLAPENQLARNNLATALAKLPPKK